MKVLVSVSGGKDSTATLCVALERVPKPDILAAFADTGNEHPMTYEYVRYLEKTLGVPIKWVKADFTEWWWHRRDYVRDVWPLPNPKKKTFPEGVPAGIVARVLAVFEKGPTGNPFLDLCIIKGRFPSRMAQFCTDELKKQPLNKYTNDLVVEYGHGQVESWQGVRADESASRAKLPEMETGGELFTIYRPILRWNVAQVFEQHKKTGIEPNPLYKLGMGRVGCMPCINARKGEIMQIGKRFPEQIDRIEEWERLVSETSKRQNSTFFTSREDRGDGQIHKIRDRVSWAGGYSEGAMELFPEEPKSCASRYGLCE